MVNIGNFSIEPTDSVDISTAFPASTGRRFPNKGWYTLRTTDTFTEESFKPNSRNDALVIQIDPTIVGPTNEGYQLKFNSGRISAKTYPQTDRSGKTTVVSQLAKFLKGTGYLGVVPGDPQEQANLVEQQAGKPFEALLDWRAWDPSTQRETKGMENFPSDGNGGYIPYLLSDTQTDDEGKPKRIWANLEIVQFSNR